MADDPELGMVVTQSDPDAVKKMVEISATQPPVLSGVREEFVWHELSDAGIKQCLLVKQAFSELLTKIEALVPGGRELALVKTKIQEASHWANQGVASSKMHQK